MKIKNVHGAPLLLIIISVLLLVVKYADLSFLSVGGNVYLTVALLEVLIFALPSLIYARLRGRKYLSHMRLHFFKAVDLPLMAFALLLMIFGGATISFYLYRIAPGMLSASATGAITVGGTDGVGTGLYAVVSAAVLPALTEEFLFRGIVLTEYERNGIGLAVILSSLTFALIHFSLIRLPIYFFNGVILALVLFATRSLFAAMLLHLANNVAVMFIEVYVYRAALRSGGSIVLFTFICTAMTLFFAFLFFGSVQKCYEDLGDKNVPSDHTKKKKLAGGAYVREALTSPFFILLCVISAVGIFLSL